MGLGLTARRLDDAPQIRGSRPSGRGAMLSHFAKNSRRIKLGHQEDGCANGESGRRQEVKPEPMGTIGEDARHVLRPEGYVFELATGAGVQSVHTLYDRLGTRGGAGSMDNDGGLSRVYGDAPISSVVADQRTPRLDSLCVRCRRGRDYRAARSQLGKGRSYLLHERFFQQKA